MQVQRGFGLPLVALLVNLLVVLYGDVALAASHLAVAFDVPADQAPRYLCVVGDKPTCPGNPNECSTMSLEKVPNLVIDNATMDARFSSFDPAAVSDKAVPKRLETLLAALRALGQPSSAKCDESHQACAPRIDLHGYLKAQR